MIYDLIGVINHFGSMGYGHYTAMAYNSEVKQWFRYNDASVEPMEPKEVVTSAAYVLFY
jgi:ubiquitin carboxyl-terminal hydrolase 4/11